MSPAAGARPRLSACSGGPAPVPTGASRSPRHSPQILMGASSSSRLGWDMKVSLAVKHSSLISFSESCTCLPGLPFRTSSRRSMMSSTAAVSMMDTALRGAASAACAVLGLLAAAGTSGVAHRRACRVCRPAGRRHRREQGRDHTPTAVRRVEAKWWAGELQTEPPNTNWYAQRPQASPGSREQRPLLVFLC